MSTEKEYKYKILIAEDNIVNTKYAEILLKRNGYIVKSVTNGIEMINEYKTGIYDLIIVDIQMPVLNGIEATKIIREEEKKRGIRGIPIVAYTAYTMNGDREMFLENGMDGYIGKPISNEDFLNEIKRCLLKWTDSSSKSSDIDNELFDFNKLSEEMNGNVEFIRELIHIFMNEQSAKIDNLKKYISERNNIESKKIIYSIRSSLVLLKAKRAEAAFKKLETVIDSGIEDELGQTLYNAIYEISKFIEYSTEVIENN